MSKYRIVLTTKFKRDVKLLKKRGYDLALLETVVDTLASGQDLAEKYRDHALVGNYVRCRECHITPDWLLIYELAEGELILYLTRTGTHSDLFQHRPIKSALESIQRAFRAIFGTLIVFLPHRPQPRQCSLPGVYFSPRLYSPAHSR